MPIVFHADVQKSFGSGEARKTLLSFMDKEEPELVKFLHNLWRNQGKAITYKQIREWIMQGVITEEILEEWQQDYSVFVVEHIRPLYETALSESVKRLADKFPLFAFDPMTEGVKHWTDTMAAAFVTNSTTEQINAVRWVVARAAQLQDMGVGELARVIRPMVGLNKPQIIANMNYYERLIEGGTKPVKAKELCIKYSARQHRYRAHMIARTEMAFAYNKGEHEGVAQAIEQGYMGKVVKVWESAGDDRVCDTCKTLDERTHRNPVDFESGFGYYTKLKTRNPDIDLTPPAHPHCRCVVSYHEVSPPNFTNTNE